MVGMKRVLLGVIITLIVSATPAFSYGHLFGFCEQGNQTVDAGGVTSTTKVQKSFPSCTVTVYDTGTITVSTIYSAVTGGALANPFTATSEGFWSFYAANGHYDVVLSGGGLSAPVTRSNLGITETAQAVRSLASNTTLTGSDGLILADASAAGFTVILSSNSSNVGQVLYIKKYDSTTNSVAITANSTDAFDNGNNYWYLSHQGSGVILVSAGTGVWYILSVVD